MQKIYLLEFMLNTNPYNYTDFLLRRKLDMLLLDIWILSYKHKNKNL